MNVTQNMDHPQNNIWYEAWSDEIKPVEVVPGSETEHFIQIKIGATIRRAKKRQEYISYFPTWEQAKEYLILKLEERISHSKDNISFLEKRLEQARGLKKPLCIL